MPCLHAIHVEPLNVNAMVPACPLMNGQDLREKAICTLAAELKGDLLAAEYLFLQLFSKMYHVFI